MRLPSIPLDAVKNILPSTVLDSKVTRSNHEKYFILRFKEEDLPKDIGSSNVLVL